MARARSKLIVFTSPGCPACSDARKILNKMGRAHGVKIKYQQVEKCKPSDSFCDGVQWVPTVAECDGRGRNCREVPLERVESRIKRMGRK